MDPPLTVIAMSVANAAMPVIARNKMATNRVKFPL
jgi:hypothetical protein